MNPTVKYVLLGVAAYLGYKWYTGQDTAAPATTTTTPATGTTPTSTSTSTSTSTTAPTGNTPTDTKPASEHTTTPAGGGKVTARDFSADSNDTVAQMAAGGDAGAVDEANRRNLLFNYHQWNYFRSQAKGVAQADPDTFSGGQSSTAVSVSTYLTALRAAGLAGLAELRAAHPQLRWWT